MTAPYLAHSPTSRAAAQSARSFAADARGRVLRLLELSPQGLTDEAIQVALDMNPNTQRPRRIELVRAGLVVDSGRQAPTRSGRAAVVWMRATEPVQEEMF